MLSGAGEATMSSPKKMRIRMRCCACGHVERWTVAAAAAFALADELMSGVCSGRGPGRCGSRDRRLEIAGLDADG
jgi:hypothetical protein